MSEAFWDHTLSVAARHLGAHVNEVIMNLLLRILDDFLQSPSLQAAALAEANCWDDLIRLFKS